MISQDNMERIMKYLFAPRSEMESAHLDQRLIERIERIRSMYSYWLSDPQLVDNHIVSELRERYGICRTMAYQDLHILHHCLGQLNKCSIDYLRWKFMARADEGFEMARKNKDAKAYARMLDVYGKYARLDRDESDAPDYSRVIPQTFEITGDPSAAGFTPIPDVEKKVRQLLGRYTLDADFGADAGDSPDAVPRTYSVENGKQSEHHENK